MAKLNKDFPSLKLGYEQAKDVLREQAEIARDYANRAITLFAVATAVIGIGLPLLFTKQVYQHYLTANIPAISLSVLPILLYVGVFVSLWLVIRPEFIRTVGSPNILLDKGYLNLEPSDFYSEVIQDIASTFSENEKIIKRKERCLTKLIACMMIEVTMVIILVLLFSSFGFLS